MADDLRALLGEPDVKPTTQTDLVSLLGEPDVKKKEEPVVGVGESGDSRSLSSTPDREFLQDTEVIVPELPHSRENLSFQAEPQVKEQPNYMGLFNKKEQISSGINTETLKQIDKSAQEADYPTSFLFRVEQIKKRLDNIPKYFPDKQQEAAQLKQSLANINKANIDMVDDAVSAIEESRAISPMVAGARSGGLYNQPLPQEQEAYFQYNKNIKDTEGNAVFNQLIRDTEIAKKAASMAANEGFFGGIENIVKGYYGGLGEYFTDYGRIREQLKANPKIKELTDKLIKISEGENIELNTEDRLLAQMVLDNYNVHQELDEKVPQAYKIGGMGGTSAGFTLEFILTQGRGSAAAQKITSGITKALAEGAAVSGAKKLGVGLAAKLAHAGIQTAWMPSYWKNTAVDVSKGEDFSTSVMKNYYKSFAENFSERVFMKNPWNKSVVGTVDNALSKMGVNMHTDKGAVGVILSTLEESTEEKISELMTAPVDYNNFDKFWKDYWDVKKNAEMIASVSLMTVPMGIVSQAARTWDNVQLNKIGKLLPSGVRSEIDEVLNDKKLTVKEQFDLVGRIVEDHAADKTLGDKPAEAAGNVIRYVQRKTKSNVVSAVEERAQTPTVGTMEEITTEDQAKLDYLESKGVKVPDGSTMATVNGLYEQEKQKEPSVVTEEINKMSIESIPEVKDDMDWARESLKEEGLSDSRKAYLERVLNDPIGHYQSIIDMYSSGTEISEYGQSQIDRARLNIEKIKELQGVASDVRAKQETKTQPFKEVPYFEDINNVAAVASKISKGEKLTNEDLQLQKNYPQEVESRLKQLKEEEIKPIEPISEPVEPRSPQEAPIVSPEQKEGLKRQKQRTDESATELKKEPISQPVSSDKKSIEDRAEEVSRLPFNARVDNLPKAMYDFYNQVFDTNFNNYNDLYQHSKYDLPGLSMNNPKSFVEDIKQSGAYKAKVEQERKQKQQPTVVEPLRQTKQPIAEDLEAKKADVESAISNYKEHGFLYHGTSNVIKNGIILPPSKTGKISEVGRKKNLDKVFFSKTEKSAKIYAGRSKNVQGGEPTVHRVVPVGNVEIINNTKGTEVLMSDYAISIPNDVVDVEKYISDKIELIQKQQIKKNIPLKEQITEVEQLTTKQDGKETSDETQGGQKGRQEVLIEAQQKTIREVKREENKQRLASIFDDIATLTGARKEITGEERRIIRKRILDNAVEYVKTEFELVGDALREKVKSFLKENNFSDEDIVDEEIDNSIKEKGYAKGNGISSQEAGQQAQGVVEGEKRRIRVRDDAKDRLEAKKRKRVKEVGENESRDSRLGIRWAWGNGYSEEAQAKFREQGLYSYKPESHSEVEAAARSIVENNSEEDALRTMRDNNVSRRIRTAIGILLIDKMDARVNDLKSKGKDKEANDVVSDIKDTMKFIQDEFATESGRDESFFGSNMVVTRLGGYTLARMAQLGMDASRTAEMGRKRFKRVEKLATEELGKARKEAVDATIKKVVPPKQKNVDVKIQEIRKKRSSLIDQWKKARENKENTYSVIIPGLTQVDIEYGGRIAATYIEEGIYQTDKLIKKLKKVFDQVGVEVKDSDLKKLIPETYEGVPFSQYQESKELEEAADMLAQRIFGDVIDKKAPSKDPIKIMVDTLFSKFRETQLDRKKTEKMSDIEKLSLAIKESKDYAKAWSEAKDYAINKITEDKNLSEGAKAIAIERVEKAYKNATELVFSDRLIKDLIRKEISERNMDVAEIVRDHYDRRGAIKEDLKKSLIEKAGLTDSEARILSDAVDSTFETLLADRVSKVVKKFTEKGKRAATAKQLKGADQVLYFTRIGAFDNAEFREAFADMWGIPKLTEEDVNYIIDQHKKIQRIKGEAMRYEEKQKLLAYIANLQGMDWNELIDGIWYANVLSGSGTQLKNLLDANTAALVEPMLIAGTSPFKRARLRNAVARAVTGRAWSNLKYTLETGNHPFDFGQETPKLSKRVLNTKEPLVKNKLQWSAIKALSRYQNVFFDIMMANDAFAGTLAYESMIDVIVTDAAYSKARKEAGRKLTKKEKEALNRKIDELLRITPEDQEIINNIVDQESEEYKKIQAEEGKKQTGYSERQRIQRTFELMDELRPVDMVEDARRISLEAVGNINPYGTLGWVMGVVTNVANNFGATFSKPVIVKSGSKFVLSAHPTDKVTIKPFQKVVPFTRIITNLATRNLNWNPITAGIRAATSKYGTFVLNKKGASGKFIREMSPEERKIIARKIFYTAAIASLGYALTGGDDPEDGLIRITGNGTGNFEKNKQLRQAGWKPWSIQIGDFSISYQYIYPLNMILSAIGWARDQQLYNDSDTPFALLYAQGLVFSIGQVLFSTPMSGISSAFDTIGSLVFEGVDSFTDKLAKMTSMIGGGFVSPRVFDDIDKLFGMVSDRADIEGVTLSEKFADRVPFVGRNFAGKVEAIDLFGDNIPLQSPAEAVMSVKVRGKNVELTKWMVEDIGYFRPMPSFKETTFIVMEKDGSINKARKLVEGNDDEGAFWTEYNKTVGSIFKGKAMAIKTLDRDKEETKKLLKDAWDKSRELAIVEMYKRSTERPLESTQIE